MKRYFVPFSSSGEPATIVVNGHRLVVLSRGKSVLGNALEMLGANSVKRMTSGQTREEEEEFLQRISQQANAGVVIAPANAQLDTVLQSLEMQLPWLQ